MGSRDRRTDSLAEIVGAMRDDRPWSAQDLVPRVYADLRRIARVQIARVGDGETSPTSLVNEGWLRLHERGEPPWSERRHFFFAASRAMRDVLVERARRKGSLRRGAAWLRAKLEPDELPTERDADALAELAAALERLSATSPRHASIVQLRFFYGLSDVESAERLGLSLRTVEREWTAIRERLRRELREPAPDHASPRADARPSSPGPDVTGAE